MAEEEEELVEPNEGMEVEAKLNVGMAEEAGPVPNVGVAVVGEAKLNKTGAGPLDAVEGSPLADGGAAPSVEFESNSKRFSRSSSSASNRLSARRASGSFSFSMSFSLILAEGEDNGSGFGAVSRRLAAGGSRPDIPIGVGSGWACCDCGCDCDGGCCSR